MIIYRQKEFNRKSSKKSNNAWFEKIGKTSNAQLDWDPASPLNSDLRKGRLKISQINDPMEYKVKAKKYREEISRDLEKRTDKDFVKKLTEAGRKADILSQHKPVKILRVLK